MSDPFHFTISDLARFLGKSPVTLRGWERAGLVTFPRDPSGDRKLTVEDVRLVARIARKASRITEHRLRLVESVATLMNLVERENK